MGTIEGFQTSLISHINWDYPKRYTDLVAIGHGAYGSVCAAQDLHLKRKVAIKKLTRPFHTAEYGKRTYRELNMLSHMDHENIVCLIDVFTPDSVFECFNDIYLVTPLMGADLNSIVKTQTLNEDHIQFLIYQILRALKYLHSVNIIHRDLKPANIAVNEDCELKILDFGLARQKEEEMTGYVATRWYRAPEIMLQWMHYDSNVDIWSVGCIMAELMTRKPLFPGKDHIDQLKKILAFTGKPDSNLMSRINSQDARTFIDTKVEDTVPVDFNTFFIGASPKAASMLSCLLTLDPARRSTAVQALEHPFLATFHEESDEPNSKPYSDPHEHETSLPVNVWRQYVWESIQNFIPRIDSILPPQDGC